MLVAGGVALVTAAARLARMPWYLMFSALPMLYQQYGLLLGMEAQRRCSCWACSF